MKIKKDDEDLAVRYIDGIGKHWTIFPDYYMQPRKHGKIEE
ncbi:MAG: hypothetical protein AB1742_10720 [bacterium]